MAFKNISLNRKFVLSFSCIVAACLATLGYTAAQAWKAGEAAARQRRSEAILQHVGNALTAMLEQAASQRAYVLFRNEEAYQSVFVNRDRMIVSIDTARRLSAGHGDVTTSLDAMRAAADVFHNQLSVPRLEARKTTEASIAEVIEIGRGTVKGQLTGFRDAAAKIRETLGMHVARDSAIQTAAHASMDLAIFIGGGLSVLLAGLLAWAMSRTVVTPIAGVTAAMGSLSLGNHDVAVPATDRADEVGSMARAVAVFREAAIENRRLAAVAEASRQRNEEERDHDEVERALVAGEVGFAVDQVGRGLNALAVGNLAYRIEKPFAPRLDRLRTDFNHALELLENAIRSVGRNASVIHAGAVEIRASVDDMAMRTGQQSASVEETAVTLGQVTTAVTDTAHRAEAVDSLVADARIRAERSGDVVNHAVSAIHEIHKSSEEIASIVGVIDDIAFQTNLLALNAGVEAARAGEAGKGFAVVAQEVRALAQRSAAAATEIKVQISKSGEQVVSGVKLVDETGRELEQIVAAVQEISRHVTAIVTVSREQSAGLEDIFNSVTGMDGAMQQNAAMAEQQTATSHMLASEAESLNGLLGQFQLSEHDENGEARRSVAA